MKALILQGSPKAVGNTAALVGGLIQGLTDAGISHREFVLSDLRIQPCRGCLKCQQSPSPGCVIHDDMHDIYAHFIDSEIIVFATPIYWWHVTGQMKTCIDRMMALVSPNEETAAFHGKRAVVAVTYGVESPHGVELVIEMFRDMTRWAQMDLHVLRHCTQKERTAECPRILQDARRLGQHLGSIRPEVCIEHTLFPI